MPTRRRGLHGRFNVAWQRDSPEGAQALVIAKQTGSVAAARELRRLGAVLRTA